MVSPGLMTRPRPTWSRTTLPATLEKEAVHVWRANIDALSVHVGRLTPLLSADEIERASRFHFERDRIRYSMGRGLLRLLLSRYLNCHPAAISFLYTPLGKPYLPQPESLSFNLSHSHGMALYAFAREAELGIDLERHNPKLEVEEIARNFFTAEEVRFLARSSPSRRHERFVLLWSRKEAYIKATAQGLSMPLNEFDVCGRSTVNGFEIQSFHPCLHFEAALAVKPRATDMLFFDVAHLDASPALASDFSGKDIRYPTL